MKKYYKIFLFSLLSCNSANSSTGQTTYNSLNKKNTNSNFDGSWYWKSKDSNSSFKLVIHQIKDSIFGQYCAAYDRGNRLDCDFKPSYNLHGRVNGNKATVIFQSFYDAKNGKAEISLDRSIINWKILIWPTGGDCFAPEKAIMTKKKMVNVHFPFE